MGTPDESSREHYDSLRQTGQDLASRGELEQALVAFDAALAWAEEHGDEVDRDRSFCNRCSVLIHLGQGDEQIRELQRLLMRSADLTNRWLAAAVISEAYLNRKDIARSQTYTQQALGYARQLDAVGSMAWAHNQLGNLLLQDSRFDESLESYEQALELVGAEQMAQRATMVLNIGYCHMTSGRLDQGFRCLFTSWRMMIRQRIRWGHLLGRIRLSLSYGYLELGRLRRAERHAWAGLGLAECAGDQELVKRALYLLGETTKQAGDENMAFEIFSRLQRDFYPEHTFLTDTLMSYDTRQLVNLWA